MFALFFFKPVEALECCGADEARPTRLWAHSSQSSPENPPSRT